MKGGSKQKSRHVKAKKQKKKYMRSKDPILAVFMWGVQHSVSMNCSGRYAVMYVCVSIDQRNSNTTSAQPVVGGRF